MRIALLLLLAFATAAPAALAQAPPDSSVVAERVFRPAASSDAAVLRPVAEQVGVGALGYVGGALAGAYTGHAIEPDGFIISEGAVVGFLVGSTIGTALGVTATGDRRGFARTLLGAAAGNLVGLAVGSSLGGDAGLVVVPLTAAAGATLFNRSF